MPVMKGVKDACKPFVIPAIYLGLIPEISAITEGLIVLNATITAISSSRA
jgi:hypothetical protein